MNEKLIGQRLKNRFVSEAENVDMGAFWRNSQCGPTGRTGCREANRNNSEGRKHCTDAQKKLQAVCAASEADREFTGVA